jgi:MFS family permease
VSLDEYGLVVASDAFAQMLFSPLFGIIADRMGRIRVVSMVCAATFCTGSAFYSLISLIPQEADGLHKPRVWATLTARFIVGIGTGQ